MNVLLQCNRCGRDMHSSGMRGMCPQCLFACSTTQLNRPEESFPQATEGALAADQTVGKEGRFLLLDKLGEGGMGEVWLADDRELSEPGEPKFVALKFLSQSIRHNPRAMQSIRAEVRRSQKLTHPNVVRIHDLHTTETGLPFISMEYVEGNSLSQWLRAQPGRVMPWRLVTLLAKQLAGALGYAHDSVGIVHRDLKPANLLLAPGDVLKLSDFGLSQAIRQRGQADEETVGGTLAYAGPQQIAGEPPSPADDIYSLGATLYELLTGTPPFQAEYLEDLLQKINHVTPDPIPQRLLALGRANEVPSKLVLLVQRCLEKDPLFRPKTSEIARLLPYLDEAVRKEASAPTPIRAEWDAAPARRNRFAEWFWRGALILVLLGLAAWFFDVGGVQERARTVIVALRDRFRSPPAPPPVEPAPQRSASNPATNGLPAPPTSSTPATQVIGGSLRLVIESASPYPFYECRVRSADGRVRYEWQLPRSTTHDFTTNLLAGDYVIEVTAGGTATATMPSWQISRTVKLPKDATASVRVPFRQALLTVQTDPPGAIIRWSHSPAETTKTPATLELRSGHYELTASLAGYRLVTTNYFFDPQPGRSANLLWLPLQPNLFPVPDENWTNSLGLAFQWVREVRALVAVTETRVADFRAFARDVAAFNGATNFHTLTADGWALVGGSWEQPGFTQTDQHPVVGVSWEDATQFCAWLTTRERGQNLLSSAQAYALPTAAEWSRLVGNATHPWEKSEADLPASVNYAGKEARRENWPRAWPVLEWREDAWPRTAPVAQGSRCASGLFDLAGNAAEWCADQVLCGGSWFDGEGLDLEPEHKHAECLWTKTTVSLPPTRRDARTGFRLIIPLGERVPANPNP